MIVTFLLVFADTALTFFHSIDSFFKYFFAAYLVLHSLNKSKEKCNQGKV